MRFRFPLAALLAALVALPAAAQQRPAFLDGAQALTGHPATDPAAGRGIEFGDPFTGVMLGTKEVPANTSAARGYAYGQFDAATNELSVYVPVSGLQGAFQAAHIHRGAAGTNGPILYPATDVFGDGPDVEIEFGVTLTDPQVVLLQAGELYVNVHSSAFPNGEIRTQLVASDFLDGVRAQPVGSTVSTLAYVARAKGAFTYLNDGLGGIAIRQTAGAFFDAVQSGAIRPGTIVRVTGTTSEFRGLLQINGPALASFEVAQVLDENINRFAQLVTLADIASDGEALESVLVAVLDVTLNGGAGGAFAPAMNYAADDGSAPASPVVLRVPSAADTEIPGRPIPTDATAVLGVVGQFTMAVPAADGYQLLVIEDYDVAPTAQVQVIHNAADPALATVRIVNGDTELVPSLAFRTATGRIDVPALAVSYIVALDASGNLVTDSFGILFPGEASVVLVLQGVANPDLFAPNPDFNSIQAEFFDLGPIPAPAAGTVRIVSVHGATDLPTIDVRTGSTVLVDDAQYGGVDVLSSAPISGPLSVTTAGGEVTFGTFSADFSGLGGQTLVLLASGFADPVANQNGAAFRLLAVREDGTATLLPLLNTAAEGTPGAEALRVSAVANPVRTQTAVRYTTDATGPARLSVVDVLGREVAVLAQGDAAAGTHEVTLSAEALAPGVYTLRLVAGGRTATARVTVVR